MFACDLFDHLSSSLKWCSLTCKLPPSLYLYLYLSPQFTQTHTFRVPSSGHIFEVMMKSFGSSLSQSFGYVVEYAQFQPSKMQLNCRLSIVMDLPPSLLFVSSFNGPQFCRALHTSINLEEALHVSECWEQKLSANCYERETSANEIQLDSFSDFEESLDGKDHKESQRRRKIGLANKGKVPWNKGRKHSEETRERIRQRTKEALRDPKVRKKMSECPRTLSNQTKARIRSSLRRLWGERLKWKRSREKFFLSWVESIAKAAKKGGLDQQELDWDSYDKMKREIAIQQLQCAADKAKAKEMARIRAERVAQAKAEKMARLAQKRKEHEQRAKESEVKRKTHKKSKEEKEELAVSQELKLKERLTKIHRKKSVNGKVTSQDHRAWERLDLGFIKRERKEVSLADQIRAVKTKKAEFVVRETLTTSSSNIHPVKDCWSEHIFLSFMQLESHMNNKQDADQLTRTDAKINKNNPPTVWL